MMGYIYMADDPLVEAVMSESRFLSVSSLVLLSCNFIAVAGILYINSCKPLSYVNLIGCVIFGWMLHEEYIRYKMNKLQ